MKIIRYLAVLPIILNSVSLYAAVQNPGCEKLQEWAAKYNARDQWQFTPKIKFPNIAKKEFLVPLFGQPITAWSIDDHANLNQWMNHCRKEAAKRRDRTAAQALSKARGAMSNLSRFVMQANQARDKAASAIDAVVNADDSIDLINAMTLAENALQGLSVRRDILSLPQDLQQHVLTLSNTTRYLPQKDVEQFTARITQRKEALQTGLASGQDNAAVELENAKKELAALPFSKSSLAALERLEKLPALKFVDPKQAQAFVMSVKSKQSDIMFAQEQAQANPKDQLVIDAIEELNQFEVKVLRDLGRLYDHGRNLKKQLKSKGVFQLVYFNEAFNRRLGEAARAQLPAFRKALEAIPSNRRGQSQLTTAIADLTGIPGHFPEILSYRAAALSRLQAENEQLASQGTSQAPDSLPSGGSAPNKKQTTKAVQAKTAATAWTNTSKLPPPTLASAPEISRTEIEGIYLGMSLDSAVTVLKEKGYHVKRNVTSKHRLGPAAEYLIDNVDMKKGESEPFPSGTMTKEEAKAYKTRLAISSVQIKKVSLSAYKGRVGMIHVSGSSFDAPDTVKEYVLEKLGAAHYERGVDQEWWNLKYFQDPKKRDLSETQLQINIEKAHYTDEIKQVNVPYTQIRYSTWICQTLVLCMK